MAEGKYTKKFSDFSLKDRQKRTFSTLSIGSNASTTVKIDSRPAVVIEVGNRLTRIGFAGEFTPREMFHTEYVDPLNPVSQPVFDASYSEKEQHLMLVKFFRNIVLRKLLTTINARRVVIVENLLTPTKVRNAIAKALFECPSLAPHSILFAPSHLLCSYPFNARNCMVVDIATKESILFPCAEGVLMLNSFESTTLCTSTVEENVRRLLLKHATIRSASEAAVRKFAKADLELLDKYKMTEDIVFRFCFATTMERGRNLQKHEDDESHEIDKPPPDIEIPFAVDTLILPGYVREAAAEVLFADGDHDNRSIPQIILDAVVNVPIDLRRVFLNNLLLVGGISRMPGLLSRLKEEMLRLMWTDYRRRLSTLQDIAFYRFEKDICVQLFCAWLGGSMFGTLDIIDSRSLTRMFIFKQAREWIAISFVSFRGRMACSVLKNGARLDMQNRRLFQNARNKAETKRSLESVVMKSLVIFKSSPLL